MFCVVKWDGHLTSPRISPPRMSFKRVKAALQSCSQREDMNEVRLKLFTRQVFDFSFLSIFSLLRAEGGV